MFMTLKCSLIVGHISVSVGVWRSGVSYGDSKESKKFRSGFQLYKKYCLVGFIGDLRGGSDIEDAIITRMIAIIALYLLVSCLV